MIYSLIERLSYYVRLINGNKLVLIKNPFNPFVRNREKFILKNLDEKNIARVKEGREKCEECILGKGKQSRKSSFSNFWTRKRSFAYFKKDIFDRNRVNLTGSREETKVRKFYESFKRFKIDRLDKSFVTNRINGEDTWIWIYDTWMAVKSVEYHNTEEFEFWRIYIYIYIFRVSKIYYSHVTERRKPFNILWRVTLIKLLFHAGDKKCKLNRGTNCKSWNARQERPLKNCFFVRKYRIKNAD